MSVINNVLKDLESRKSQFTPIEIASIPAANAPHRGLRPWLPAGLLVLSAAVVLYLLYPQANSLLAGSAASSAPVVPESSNTVVTMNQPGADEGSSGTRERSEAKTVGEISDPSPASVLAVVASTEMETAGQEATVAEMPDAVEPQSGNGDSDMLEVAIASGEVSDRMIGNQIIGLQLRESEREMQMEFVLRDRVVAYLRERGENHFAYRLSDIESQIVAPKIRDNRWIRDLSIRATGSGVDIDFETTQNILVETRQQFVEGESVWVIVLREGASAPESAPESAPAAVASTAVPSAEEASPVAQPLAVAAPAEAEAEIDPVRLEIKTTDPNAKSVNELEYASELIASRRHAEAEALLRRLLGGAEDRKARMRLLALYDIERRQDLFMQTARESMQNYPQDNLFQAEYARALFYRGDYREVIAMFAGRESLNATQQAVIAASHQRLEEHDDAVRHYRLALAQDASDARNWVGLGISQEHTAALEDALVSYQQAARLGSLNDSLRAFVQQRSNTLRQVLN